MPRNKPATDHITIALGFRVPRAAQANVNRWLLASADALEGMGAELAIGKRSSIMKDGTLGPVDGPQELTDRQAEMLQFLLEGWHDNECQRILLEVLNPKA